MIIALSSTDAAVNRDVPCVRLTPSSVGLTAICRLPVRHHHPVHAGPRVHE